MSTMTRIAVLYALLSFVAPQSVLAHHSAVAFDRTKTQVVEGTVTKFIWRNPHLSHHDGHRE